MRESLAIGSWLAHGELCIDIEKVQYGQESEVNETNECLLIERLLFTVLGMGGKVIESERGIKNHCALQMTRRGREGGVGGQRKLLVY